MNPLSPQPRIFIFIPFTSSCKSSKLNPRFPCAMSASMCTTFDQLHVIRGSVTNTMMSIHFEFTAYHLVGTLCTLAYSALKQDHSLFTLWRFCLLSPLLSSHSSFCNKLYFPGVFFLCKQRMLVGATGMAWVGGATVSIRALVPVSYLSGAAHSSELRVACTSQRRIALIPSCLSSPISSLSYRRNLRNVRASQLPSILYSTSPSWCRSSISGSATFRGAGLNGKLLVQDGRLLVGRGLIVRCMAEQSESILEDMILSKNSQNAVVVYSKSWCPYCSRVKSLFKELGVEFLLVELDNLVEEQEVQEALCRLTRQSTVPNIFIGGKHIGGCDNTMDLHKRGELMPLLKAAGAKIFKS